VALWQPVRRLQHRLGSAAVSVATTSNETLPVTDFEITFGSPLDPLSITRGMTQFQSGFEFGGTLWATVFNLATPDSVAFIAPARIALAPGEGYPVDIFLPPGDGVSGEAFSGA
jgi:hypothetical protein